MGRQDTGLGSAALACDTLNWAPQHWQATHWKCVLDHWQGKHRTGTAADDCHTIDLQCTGQWHLDLRHRQSKHLGMHCGSSDGERV
eukprot:351328-Chlamydomonas_euryale.AAC.13